MRATTHTPVEELETDDEHETPWWADRAVLIPIASGVAFVAGLACEWSGAQSAALVLFWVGRALTPGGGHGGGGYAGMARVAAREASYENGAW